MLENVGIDLNTEKAQGVYLQRDNAHDLCVSNVVDVEIMPIHDAFEKYDGTDGKMDLKDYLWKAVPKDKDIRKKRCKDSISHAILSIH